MTNHTMKIYKNIIQGTQEWHALRELKMTASNATAIASQGQGLTSYIKELVYTHLSVAERISYTNDDMERGKALEPLARLAYEQITNNKVTEVGFITLDKYTGCSPDGLISRDGGLEIKCINDKNYFNYLIATNEEKYKLIQPYIAQIQMCLYITKRKYWDLVIYNPNFTNQPIQIFNIIPDPDHHEQIKMGLAQGKALIKRFLKLAKHAKVTPSKKATSKSKK